MGSTEPNVNYSVNAHTTVVTYKIGQILP